MENSLKMERKTFHCVSLERNLHYAQSTMRKNEKGLFCIIMIMMRNSLINPEHLIFNATFLYKN